MAGSEIKIMWERHLEYLMSETTTIQNIHGFLKAHGYSASVIRHLKETENGICKNGVWARVGDRLNPGDLLTIRLTEADGSEQIEPVCLPFPIVYEDSDLLVINKPSGMPVHPSQGNHTNTLANACAWYFQQKKEPFTFRCINRLDRDTTGLLILARHAYSASLLSRQVADRKIHREYLAVAQGCVPPEGCITAPIARALGSTIEREVNEETGEYACTHFRRLEYKNGYSLTALKLDTGRTHQIRVHMKFIGHPLPGDFLYHPDMSQIERQALHSWKLAFSHPITKKPLSFTAPLPEDMQFPGWDGRW